MIIHHIAAAPEARAGSLVVQERGLSGIDLVLTKQPVPTDVPGLRKVLADPRALLGAYFLPAKALRSFIDTLQEYAQLMATFEEYLEDYQGWEDAEFRERALRSLYRRQEGKAEYQLRYLDLKLFVPDCHDNYAAQQRVARDWAAAHGELSAWGIVLEQLFEDQGVWGRAQDLKTVLKFETWLYETYIGPALHELQYPATESALAHESH